MEETPISDKNNLSVNSYGTGFLENFIYEIGLLLDSEIPVYGFTNSQRIEIAVNRYISQSARIRELEGALENADRFIRNGVEFGYIELPAAGDPAHNTIDRIKQALNKTKTE